jgi:hypothetical protein
MLPKDRHSDTLAEVARTLGREIIYLRENAEQGAAREKNLWALVHQLKKELAEAKKKNASNIKSNPKKK